MVVTNTLFGEHPWTPGNPGEGVGHDKKGDQRVAGEQAPLGRGRTCGGVTDAHNSTYPFCSVRLVRYKLEHIEVSGRGQGVGASLAKHLLFTELPRETVWKIETGPILESH